MNKQAQIRLFTRGDITPIVEDFNQIGWNKPVTLADGCLSSHRQKLYAYG